MIWARLPFARPRLPDSTFQVQFCRSIGRQWAGSIVMVLQNTAHSGAFARFLPENGEGCPKNLRNYASFKQFELCQAVCEQALNQHYQALNFEDQASNTRVQAMNPNGTAGRPPQGGEISYEPLSQGALRPRPKRSLPPSQIQPPACSQQVVTELLALPFGTCRLTGLRRKRPKRRGLRMPNKTKSGSVPAANRKAVLRHKRNADPFTILEKRILGPKKRRYSFSNALIAKAYKDAWEGDTKAASWMLDILEKIEEENAKRRRENIILDRGGPLPSPRNANAALILLGIACPDDSFIDHLEKPSEKPRIRERRFRYIRPVRVTQWAYDMAMVRECFVDKPPVKVCSCNMEESLWHIRRDALLPEMVWANRPGATKYEKGQSGNRKGRPAREPLPYDGFLTQLVITNSSGKPREMMRIEALLLKLCGDAFKGDKDIARVLKRPIARRVVEAWHDKMTDVEIIRIGSRDYEPRWWGIGGDLQELKIASRRAKKKVLIDPIYIEAALARLGRELDAIEQAIVMRAVGRTAKVKWPDWWQASRDVEDDGPLAR